MSLSEKYFPSEIENAKIYIDRDIGKTTVVRLAIDEINGKEHKSIDSEKI
jgi:hypothetical protein